MGKSDLSVLVAGSLFLIFLLFVLLDQSDVGIITGYIVSSSDVFSNLQFKIADRSSDGSVTEFFSSPQGGADFYCSFNYSSFVSQSEKHFDLLFLRNDSVVPAARFTDLTEGDYDDFSDSNGAFCFSDSLSCVGFYSLSNAEKGRWICSLRFWNSTTEVFLNSSSSFILGNAESTLHAPRLIADLPDVITLSNNGSILDFEGGDEDYHSGFILDLENYFDDPDNDSLEYRVSGDQFIDVRIDSDGDVTFIVPFDYEGKEELVFYAFDNAEKVVAPSLSVIVGSGISSPSCSPFWSCSPFEACISSVQTRSCTDLNSCSSLEGRPSLTRPCDQNSSLGSASSGPSVSLQGEIQLKEPLFASTGRVVALIFVLLALLGMIGGVIYFVYRARKEHKSFFDFKKKTSGAKDTLSKELISTSSSNDDSSLDTYIRKALAQKQKADRIRSDLLHAGWPKETVVQKVNELSLESFINEKLRLGFSKEVIRKSLLNRKWPQEFVDKVLSKIK